MVDSENIRTMDDNIKVVQEFPTPTSVDNVRSFLGLSYYYISFVKGYTFLASLITQMLKIVAIFHCDLAQKDSFQRLNTAVEHVPILAFSIFTRLFLLSSDGWYRLSSNWTYNSSYDTRILNNVESRYYVIHMKLLLWYGHLSISDIWYLVLRYIFLLIINHFWSSLNFKDISALLIRWYFIMLKYRFSFLKVLGHANIMKKGTHVLPVP